MSEPLTSPLTGTVQMDAAGPLLSCNYPEDGPIIFVRLLRSAPPENYPDHDARQRASTYLRYELGKQDGDSVTITQGFWSIPGSTEELCILTAI